MSVDPVDGERGTDGDRDGDGRPDRVELLRIRIGDRTYGVEVGRVDNIARVPEVTRVPRVPPTVAGVARPRGDTVVVIDAHELFDVAGSPPDGSDPRHRFLQLDRDTPGTGVGFVVDEVERTVVVDVADLAPADRHADIDADTAATTGRAVDDGLLFVFAGDGAGGTVPVIDVDRVVAVATNVAGQSPET
jgi:purine-binding chemotaxis protein CheW